MAEVIDIEPMQRFGVEDRIWIHFKVGSINYYLATDAKDTSYFHVNRFYPFLVNR